MSTRLMMTIFRGALAVLLGLMFTPAPAFANTSALADSDGQSCSEQTLSGSYLFATHGFNIVGGVAQPKAIVEGINFHGDGTLVSPFATVSVNGLILRFAETTGFYTVEPSCEGTLTFTGGPSFDIFVEPSGKQLWMIQTDPNTVFEGTVTKVSRGR